MEATTDEIRRWYGFYSELVAGEGDESAYAECKPSLVNIGVPAKGLRVPAAAKRGVDIKVADSALHRARMEPMLIALDPARDTGSEPEAHLGEEIILAIEGKIDIDWLRQPGDEFVTTEIQQGGLVHLNSETPHRVINRSGEPALLLVIKSPPDRYAMHTLEKAAQAIRQPKSTGS